MAHTARPAAGRPEFRRQVPLGTYITNLACFDPKAIVECDGGQHAESAYDAERDAWFRSQGFRVVRVWNRRLLDADEQDGVVQELLALLYRR